MAPSPYLFPPGKQPLFELDLLYKSSTLEYFNPEKNSLQRLMVATSCLGITRIGRDDQSDSTRQRFDIYYVALIHAGTLGFWTGSRFLSFTSVYRKNPGQWRFGDCLVTRRYPQPSPPVSAPSRLHVDLPGRLFRLFRLSIGGKDT